MIDAPDAYGAAALGLLMPAISDAVEEVSCVGLREDHQHREGGVRKHPTQGDGLRVFVFFGKSRTFPLDYLPGDEKGHVDVVVLIMRPGGGGIRKLDEVIAISDDGNHEWKFDHVDVESVCWTGHSVGSRFAGVVGGSQVLSIAYPVSIAVGL